jgi:hypothetical protein
MTIQAIETSYAGCRFRSRLEARWAHFFDTLGVRWEYEPQGYHVGEQRRPYLPDFCLSDLGTWVEVKGSADRLDASLMLDAVHPTLGLGRTDPYYRTNMLILGDLPRPGVPHAHWVISRSAAIGTPPSPVPGCGGCLFTGPLYGLSSFWPVTDLMPDLVAEKAGASTEQLAVLRRWGALLQPVCRSTHKPPRVDLTAAVPVPRMGVLHRLDMAYEKARAARFEHGEAA